MIVRYFIYITADAQSGYYTGKNYINNSGNKYPGTVEDSASSNIKLYVTLDEAIKVCKELAKFQSDKFSFKIIDFQSNLVVYTANYFNGKLESEYKF